MLSKKKRKGYGKFSWTLTPPEELIEAGLARPQTFHDGRTALAAKRSLEKTLKAFREGKLAGDFIPQYPTIRMLSAHYLNTKHFNSLSKSTRELYRLGFEKIANTPFKSKTVGDLRVQDITSQMCHQIYESWLEGNSAAWANDKKRLWGVLYSYALSLDLVERNPMASVKAVHHEPESNTWTRQQVEQFLDVAFKDFKYRSIGLLVMLCYEWGQRPVDIANLRWYDLDFNTDTATIVQQKRGAEVQLPIEGQVKQLLLKQKEDFDFQEYVLPYLRQDNAWRPMTQPVWNNLFNEVRDLAGLPDDLYIRNLRTTAITEMIESGVDTAQVKQVTGHKDISSLNPYIRNTRKGAKGALDARKSI
jgi:integrase